MSCEEWGQLDFDDRSSALNEMLTEHRLEPNHVGNLLGVTQAVAGFCGTMMDSPARQNLDQPIGDAVDWESETW